MLRIVVATDRPQALQAFTTALSSNPEVRLKCVGTGAEALEAVRVSAPQLVIIDKNLCDSNPLELVRKLLKVNAMVNTAVVSSLSEDEFHAVSEGLGVLGRLPAEPGEQDVVDLLRRLKTVLGEIG
jgi:DNA-binding NarL/FixJ family response regulator